MTYVTPRVVRFLIPALAFASLFVAACGSPTICNCPNNTGIATVSVPTPVTTPPVLIINAWTDPPCSATHDNVSKVTVTSMSVVTCQVGVLLSNGEQYSFTVEFEKVDVGCCPGLIRVARTTTPEPFDGGARDGG